MTRKDRPTLKQLERELARRDTLSRYMKAIRITIVSLVFVVSISVLLAVIWIPILRVTGTSMTPTLYEDEIVVVRKTDNFKTGEMIAFYYNNKILIKRAIAGSGDMVYMDDKGNVYVNNELVDEPYAVDKGQGICDLKFPYQVPEDCWFVLGDHRSTSVDSRSDQIGCVKQEDVIGKVSLRIYPLNKLSFLTNK